MSRTSSLHREQRADTAARRVLVNLTLVGGLVWLALLVWVRQGVEPHRWPLELLDTFALYGLLPYLVVAALAVATRSRRLLIPLLGAVLFFVLEFGHYFLSAPVPAGDGLRLRVLTYNVRGVNQDAGELAEFVRQTEPDIVALQELTSGFADDFEREVGQSYPHRYLSDVRSRNDGAGTYSKLPILEADSFRITERSNSFQHLRLDRDGRTFSLFNVHPDSPNLRVVNPTGPVPPLVRGFVSTPRDREIEWLLKRTAELDEPYILAGDFNSAAGSRPYRRFSERWRDAFAERGWGFGHTFPTFYSVWQGRIRVSVPLVRIDYVLSSPDVVPLHAEVPSLEGSDHLPVLADLRLPANPDATAPRGSMPIGGSSAGLRGAASGP